MTINNKSNENMIVYIYIYIEIYLYITSFTMEASPTVPSEGALEIPPSAVPARRPAAGLERLRRTAGRPGGGESLFGSTDGTRPL